MDKTYKKTIILVIFCLVALIFIARLLNLQILDESYIRFAQSNVLQEQTIYPARGLIYDRNGELLVYNDAIYDISVMPDQILNLDTNEFCRVLGITKEDFVKKFDKMKKQKGYATYRPAVFERQLTIPQYAAFQEKLFDFQGFFPEVRTDRRYSHSNAAHVMGYIGEVTDRDIEKSDGYYRMGDFIGISGVEKVYEKELGGIKGTKYVLVDSKNRTQGRYKNGEFDTPAVAGNNITLTLDYRMQELGENLMEGKIGSVVAIEPKTGEILALVSSPTYDPNLLIGRDRGNQYMKLLQDPSKPLFNRPLSAPYPPGSIFKVLMSLVGQQEGVLNPNTTYACHHGYLFVGCHPHASPLNLRPAIAISCNAYFCQVYRSVVNNPRYKKVEDAYKSFHRHMASFGLGAKLGVDLFSEGKGLLPTSEYYDKIYGRYRWQALTTISLGIGQGELGITPLQMANATSAVANKGYFITPHVVKLINGKPNFKADYHTKRYTTVDSSYFDVVIDGMQGAVENGTARIARIPGITICGKTGTAQNPHGKDHSVFFAFAPRENPKIAIAVIVENAGFGATWAAPIASLLIEQYLTGKHDTRTDLLERMLKVKLEKSDTTTKTIEN